MNGTHPIWLILLIMSWIVVWGVVGGLGTPRVYRRKRQEDTLAAMGGAILGILGGPLFLVPVWIFTPKFDWRWLVVPALALVGVLIRIYAIFDPDNLCLTSGRYVISQVGNGLVIGFIYALMAVGLTLIYSIQGIISFAHGQFYMVGGYVSFYLLSAFTNLPPLAGVLVAGLVTMLLGFFFERLLLRPMHRGQIERPGEYAILITFGLGFFLQYTVLALIGPYPKRARSYLDVARLIRLGPVNIPTDRAVASIIAIVLLASLLLVIGYTWLGKALRAVSMDKQAAAIVGIDPLVMNTIGFGIGTMLAGMAGAALVPVFAWVPWVGVEAASRSYVIIVLGGLGSIPGALLGGLIIGLVEALGTGCFPDPSRGLSYREVFGLIIFALVLLFRPTGLLGRKL